MKLLSTAEVAEMVGQSKSAIDRACRNGYLPFYKVGKCNIFVESEVIEAVESGQYRVRPQGRPKVGAKA